MMKDRLLSVLSEGLRTAVDETVDSENMTDWDSLAHMRIIVGLEDEFDIEVDDEQISNLNSYEAIYNYLQHCLDD